MTTVAAPVGPNLEPARRAGAARSTARRRSTTTSTAFTERARRRLRRRAPPVEPRGRARRRHPGGARADAAAIVINAGAFTHYAWAHPRRPRRLRRARRRAPPVQPLRPGAVAAHVGRLAGRRRGHLRLRWRRLPPGGPGREGAAVDDATAPADAQVPTSRCRRWTSPAGPIASAAALGRRVRRALVTKLVNIRWLTGFTGSAGSSSCAPTAPPRHRRPLRRAGRRAAGRRRGRRPRSRIGLTDRRAVPRSSAPPPTGLAARPRSRITSPWAEQRRHGRT